MGAGRVEYNEQYRRNVVAAREEGHLLSGQRRALTACGAVIMAFFLCACDFSSNSASSANLAASTPVPLGRPALKFTPSSAGQAIAGPNQVQPPSTSAATPTLHSPPQPTPTLPPAPYPYPTWRATQGSTTIAKWPSISFPVTVFNYLNHWSRIRWVETKPVSSVEAKPATEYELRVYAGGEGQQVPGGDPEQGVLVVVTATLGNPGSSLYLLGDPDVYRTPSKVGPVQIVWADYSRVLVVAADDTAFLFDVSTRRWLWPPNVKQPDNRDEQDYQARMKTLLIPYLPPPPPPPTTVADILRPDPTDVPSSAPPGAYDDIGQPSGAGRLIQGCESPAAGQPFLRRNCWYTELIDGTQIGLAAGYGRKEKGWAIETGLIIVDGCPGDYNNGAYSRYYNSGLYVTPRKVRPAPTVDAQGHRTFDWVKIVDTEGERIHLVSGDGVEFTFDLATCHWVEPPVPTATVPPPTLTPVPPSPTESPWYSSIPPGDERNYVLKMEQLSSSVLTAVALTPLPGTPTPTASIPPTATPNYAGAGIIVDGPFPPAQSETFRYRNYWYEMQGGERISVYAGVEGSKGSRVQGMIEVDITSPDGKRQLQAAVYYRTPTQSGYVEVVGADGEKLHLRTWNGTEFVFDLPSHQWLKP
jgi:hypothetical protein